MGSGGKWEGEERREGCQLRTALIERRATPKFKHTLQSRLMAPRLFPLVSVEKKISRCELVGNNLSHLFISAPSLSFCCLLLEDHIWPNMATENSICQRTEDGGQLRSWHWPMSSSVLRSTGHSWLLDLGYLLDLGCPATFRLEPLLAADRVERHPDDLVAGPRRHVLLRKGSGNKLGSSPALNSTAVRHRTWRKL